MGTQSQLYNLATLKMADELKRAVVWKSLLMNGTDYCSLWHTPEGWLLTGTVTGAINEQKPMLATYEIHCDESWLAHRVEVERTIGSEIRTLSLNVQSRGVWRSAGTELPAVNGCDDVDLSITPATNTLVIRRLNLEVGSSASVIAAWVKFPELTVQPLSQRYTRLAKSTYRYESNTGFSAEITVDDLGLVVSYPNVWERIAAI
jgi:uncharacterized protein